MNEQGLLAEGFTLLLLGMGTVFVFLTLLVIVTSIMSRVIQAWFPTPVAETSVQPVTTGQGQLTDDHLVAVITAAIHQHRKSGRR